MFQEPTIEVQGKEIESDRNNLKIAIIAIFGVVASIFLIYTFLSLLIQINFFNFLTWIFAVLIFFIVSLLQPFFIKRFSKLATVCLFEALSGFVFVLSQVHYQPSISLITGFIIFLCSFLWASYQGSKFLAESFSIRFSFVTRMVFSRLLFGLLIFFSLIVYTWYFEKNLFNPNDGYMLINTSIISIEPVLNIWFPGASVNQTAESFFKKVAEENFRKPSGIISENNFTSDNNFQVLTEKQKEQVLTESGEKLRINFEKSFGSFPKDVLVKDALFSIIKNKISNLSENGKPLFSFCAILLFFLLSKGFFIFYGFVIRLIAFLFYKLLIATGFAFVSTEVRNREFLLLS